MSSLNFDAALTDAAINASIEKLSLHQKLMLIAMLTKGSERLRYNTYLALERMGFVHDRLAPGYPRRRWDELTTEGTIAALRLLSPEYKDYTLFYQAGKQRLLYENARREMAEYRKRQKPYTPPDESQPIRRGNGGAE